MNLDAMKCSSNILDIYRRKKYLKEFARTHPNYFQSIGTMIFCGKQGSGKTLSAVNYTYNILSKYPFAILCTNVAITDYPFNAHIIYNKENDEHYIATLDTDEIITSNKIIDGTFSKICIEYDGLDCLKFINNGYLGVLYLIDELHLELNSLESKNIDIDVMTEISQQRKQRKHIVGTSQVYMRLAKPLREQIFDVVICSNFFGWLQYNKLIDGEDSKEENGKLNAVIKKRVFWIHKPEYYSRYDTFAKMKRYQKEWQGHKRETVSSVSPIILRSDKK